MKTFEDLQKANELVETIKVKDKDYALVNQRIKAFRYLYPEGTIETMLISDDGEKCVFHAIASIDGKVLGTGTAYEMKESSYINKTSYIENCETSAVGRALAMCGIGIDVSIASAEEVQNAINNQGDDVGKQRIDAVKIVALTNAANSNGVEIEKILKLYKVKSLANLTEKQFSDINMHWKEIKASEI